MSELAKLIATQEGYTLAALLRVLSYQTADEQQSAATKYDNGMGFNGVDAGICTDMTRFFNRTGGLSEAQVKFLQRILPKYAGQCVGIEPIENRYSRKKREPEPRVVDIRDNRLVISFPYDAAEVARVKSLEGRRFHKDKTAYWTAVLS